MRDSLRPAALVGTLLLLLGTASVPAAAHEKKKHQQTTEEQQHATPGGRSSAAMQGGPTAEHAQMGEMMGDQDAARADRSKMGFAERLISWVGRLHPLIVHFPIAFFPAALFTAVVGRKRPAFATPVQFLVVAGGISAPLAAVAGWLDAVGADPDPILTYHRWLGTAVGIGGLALAIWAWRRPWEDRGAGMIVALTAITIGIVVQGWFGAALVHGIEHLMF